MKFIFAIAALFVGANAVKLEYVDEQSQTYPWGTPYNYAEKQGSLGEVADAWKVIKQREEDAEFEKKQKFAEEKKITDYFSKVEDWNKDISNPSHNEFHPRKFEIVSGF